jgi:hypothetical protein
MLSRRSFCLSASALALPGWAAADDRAILVTASQATRIKDRLGASAGVVRELADAALKAGPWSVTTTRPKDSDAGPNDYYSEGPYWWPDPKNPGGPYIRKDGERYPGRFTANRNDLGAMCGAVLSLGMGSYLLGDRRCTDHAARVLSTWCLDPKTRMNPNLSGRRCAATTPVADRDYRYGLVHPLRTESRCWRWPACTTPRRSAGGSPTSAWMTTSKKAHEKKGRRTTTGRGGRLRLRPTRR